MGDSLRNGSYERDVEQAITALKKGAHVLKYGRRGKPKFCPFRLSVDESALIWYVGKVQKQLILNQVTKIIPGQRTAIFQRYPQPDKEYQSFSLIYKGRSLDLICKDKDEAEVWFVGLKALISGGIYRKKLETEGDRTSNSSGLDIQSSIRDDTSYRDSIDLTGVDIPHENGLGKSFPSVVIYTAPRISACNSSSSLSSSCTDNANNRGSGAENIRISSASAVSSSSHGSGFDDFDALNDVYIWGEITTDGGPTDSSIPKADAPLPKALQTAMVLDVQHIACGSKYITLVTKQGEIYSWGEELGGRLGHGVDANVTQPKLIDNLSDMNIQLVACGEYHSCALTMSGNLYTWGDGVHKCGLLGHGTESSHYIPKLVAGPLYGIRASSVSCGPWHTAIVTYSGQLFTFGNGTFGALGHGDRLDINIPKEVEALEGYHIIKAACGVWHTAAIVEIIIDNFQYGKLFTWGDGDKGKLGHGDEESRLFPACVESLTEPVFCQVACGQDMTVALSICGKVYTMGRYNHEAGGRLPTCVEGKLKDNVVEAVACGYHHIAVLTSKAELYTWGKGANGQLGQGDRNDLNAPTLVETLKGKQVRKVVCGPKFTAVICTHKLMSSDEMSMCSGCHLQFGFRRKRHNCYNCGLVFCTSCSTRRSVKAALAPNTSKPYRVCDDCYNKIKKSIGSGTPHCQVPKLPNGSPSQLFSESVEKEPAGPKLLSSRSFKSITRQKQSYKTEADNNRSPLILNEKSPWGSIRNVLYHAPNRLLSASVPGTRIPSRSTSPVHSVPSPSYSMYTPTPEAVDSLQSQVEDLTHRNQLLEVKLELTSKQFRDATAFAEEETAKYKAAEEINKSLSSQLADLTQRNHLLEVKLEQTSKKFREATAIGEEECAKYEAAREVNRSLSSQLKEMAERIGEGYVIDANGTLSEELDEFDEPGVFITVSFNPGGDNYLKRVHFSRRQFNQQQATKWWSDNRQRLQQKYNFSSCLENDRISEIVD